MLLFPPPSVASPVTYEEANGPSTSNTTPPQRGRSCGRIHGREESRSLSPGSHDGRWNTEADPDLVPNVPRFTPKRTPGVQPPLTFGKWSPLDICSQYFDEEVINILCANTNKNAMRNLERGRKFTWADVYPEEMKKYIGLLLYMGVMDLPKVRDFWRKKTLFHVPFPFPATVMSRDRFLAISCNLHISGPMEDAENDKKRGTEEYDCLHRVQPVLDIMRNRCMSVYHPRQNISVDERMIATKARIFFKQYMKAKPTKWGIKLFVLADVNGYTVDFKIYTGKSKFASGKGLSFDVVTSLVNRDYLGSGYVIYCDNFYTSPLLFRHLHQLGFGACGTCREGSVGVPSTKQNAPSKRSPRGSIRWIRDDVLLFVKWMDTREVTMCTIVHTVYSGETVLRWQTTEDGQKEKVPVPRPTAVQQYNKYMGGVDTSDQMLGTNSVHRKTRKWYMTIFQHFLDIAVTNSFILHKELCAIHHDKHMTQQNFQELLAAQLTGVPLDSSPKERCDHLPVPVSDTQDLSQRASMGRRCCIRCKRSTPWKCQECDVGLCLQLDRNCFREEKDWEGLRKGGSL
uniref:PiggyBac transposable element-derived protein domain-containing protein n=1 Tax=Sinocyclocheilus rhinocerous TaxID=307959 RepID=A0A673I8T7_9TELE